MSFICVGVLTIFGLTGIFVAQATNEDDPYYRHESGFNKAAGELKTIPGYCSRRQGHQCCPGRDDSCTMPFGDTLCYCDIFCNRSLTDCCPDFLPHCFGIHDVQPLRTRTETTAGVAVMKNNCYHYGHLHNSGDKITVNCNNCTCVNAVLNEELNWKCTQKVCIVRQKVLRLVNDAEKQNSWRASNYSIFWGLSLDAGVKYWLGTHQPTSHITEMSQIETWFGEDLPEEFDARQEWPGLISPVLNQNGCASSWAFSIAGVVSDRLSIHSNGIYRHTLSPQHLISCNTDHGHHGCRSGHIDRAWWFIRKVGIVSLACFPYVSGDGHRIEPCTLPRSYLALKNSTCPSDGSPITVFQTSPPYHLASDEKTIMAELIENGPVQAVIRVNEDFYLYKSGVYQHLLTDDDKSSDEQENNFHSVRILGWGTDHSTGRPIKYWLCANSWGSGWGENGYFRILRGKNESSIESYVIGGWIKVNDRMLIQKRKKLPT